MLPLTSVNLHIQNNPVAKKVFFSKRTQLCLFISATSLKIAPRKKPILTQFSCKIRPQKPDIGPFAPRPGAPAGQAQPDSHQASPVERQIDRWSFLTSPKPMFTAPARQWRVLSFAPGKLKASRKLKEIAS
jgi:hypothetical protein